MWFPNAADIKGPLLVGRWYGVQCIKMTPFNYPKLELWVPLFGEMHWDSPDVGCGPSVATGLHWHFDMRFLKPFELLSLGLKASDQGAAAIGPGNGYHRDQIPVDSTVKCSQRWEIRRCLRPWLNHTDWPPQPCGGARARFERPFKKCQINPRHPVCPHQNFDLSGVNPTIINGRPVLVCPGHKLGWCAKTGEFVPSQGDL